MVEATVTISLTEFDLVRERLKDYEKDMAEINRACDEVLGYSSIALRMKARKQRDLQDRQEIMRMVTEGEL